MWDPRRLITLWTLTACYRDSFTFFICKKIASRDCLRRVGERWTRDLKHSYQMWRVVVNSDHGRGSLDSVNPQNFNEYLQLPISENEFLFDISFMVKIIKLEVFLRNKKPYTSRISVRSCSLKEYNERNITESVSLTLYEDQRLYTVNANCSCRLRISFFWLMFWWFIYLVTLKSEKLGFN
jgi:hypothetical protein